MNASETSVPRNIREYLSELRRALAGADPAMIQDALNDAEEHLRAECAARPGESEEAVLRAIADSYGAPTDVAAAYRETERTVQSALAMPRRPAAVEGHDGDRAVRRFFGVFGDIRSWTSLVFMLLSLVTGILYFTVAVTGIALSLGLSILIIGIPFFVAFIGLTRVLALVEGRLIEAMTGERMPRRTSPSATGGWILRIGAMLRDRRTWTTLAYQLLMLPLGIVYFVFAVTLAALGLGLLGGGGWEVLRFFEPDLAPAIHWAGGVTPLSGVPGLLLALAIMIGGAITLTMLMHLARLIGRSHGKLAKHLLVTA
jgi:uncharacterized membrane protein